MDPALLAGVRVLALTTSLSGPVTTRALGQLRAEVVKIEPPAGDPTRPGLAMRPIEASACARCAQPSR
jgi:crotonobetainyl-CoA:carnitine CoA-transferase CaiB-like acyl-CoA transferase